MFIEQGKIHKIMPVQSGTTKAGKPWHRQTIVIEKENGNYIDYIAADANNSTRVLPDILEGDTVEIGFVVSSREYDGRWYTDIRLIYLDHLDLQGNKTNDNTPYRIIAAAKATYKAAQEKAAEAEETKPEGADDLPF